MTFPGFSLHVNGWDLTDRVSKPAVSLSMKTKGERDGVERRQRAEGQIK